ncbi:MAG: YfhO family protein [Hespellia sp.]|nr:YfhO family protein [Hespellia sp.]
MREKNKKTVYTTLILFVGTMAVYILIQWLSGLYPFGDKLNLLWDEDIQYVDYFAFYRDVLLGKNKIGYSFSKSLGGSLVALFGYYLGSPLNLLVVFFDTAHLPLFVFLITMLKLGLCSVTASVFMRGRFPDLEAPAVIGLSMGYGLMQYMMLHCSNIMWLDGVFFLPLLLLAVYRYVQEKKRGFLFLWVMLSIAINWYTGYMICLFAACYFLYERLLLVEKFSFAEVRTLIWDGVRCAFTMLLGLGGSAVVFYPVFKGLQKGKSVWDPTIFYPEFYDSFWDIFRGFVEGSIVGTVSLYCGLIFFIFFVYYFLSKRVKRYEKVLSGIAVLFMFVSCWFVPLDCIWSGMRRVASFRFRYSFVVIFLVLYLAARGIEEYQRQRDRRMVGLIFLGSLAMFLFSHVYRNYESETFWATFSTLFIYMLIYFLVREQKVRVGLLAVVLIAELTANGVLTFAFNYGWNPNVEAYIEYASQAEKQAAQVQEYDDSIFYRMDTVSKRYNEESRCSAYLNDAMAYGYHGMAHYSSTFDTDISDMIYGMGYSSLHDLSIYTQPILPTDALLGIKYVLSRENLEGLEKIEQLGTINDKDVYWNPYALGLGMAAADTVFENAESEDPFAYQNQLFSNILGKNVELFHRVDAEPVIEGNVLSFVFEPQAAEKHLYGFVESRVPDLVLYVDGEYRCNYACWLSYRVFDIGKMEQAHRIDLDNYFGTEADMQPYFYYLDQNVFEETIAELQKNPFLLDTFEDGYVAGTYEAKKAGNLLLTIPYDEGWRVQVNGTRVEFAKGANALTVLPVEQGMNQIVMKYHVPGQVTGILISVFSIMVMLFWCWFERRKSSEIQRSNQD